MKIVFGLIFILGAAGPACAQRTEKSTAAVTAVQAPRRQAQKQRPVPQPSAKSMEQDPVGNDQADDEGGVMIDTPSGGNVPERFIDDGSGVGAGGPADPGGMPSSYGQLKGTLNDGSRSLLVFEDEEGTISFVQVVPGKNSVSWKFVAKISRSPD